MKKRVDVAGKVVLITGAARGMGKLWAEHFARDGARLVLWDLDGEELERTAAQLRTAGVAGRGRRSGGSGATEVRTAVVDVTDRARVHEEATATAAGFGPVDIVVNNAGIVAGGRFEEMPEAKLAAVLDVNLKSLVFLHKAFLPQMLERGAGHFINVSSASGFIGVPYMPTYAASKWGVIGFTESLRLEMELAGHTGIRFTLFCPSYVDTGMFKGVRAPLLVPLLTPEKAVQQGYAGFRRGEYMVRVPLMVRFTPALKALLPQKVFDSVSEILGVTTSMKNWRGH
jgi:NAD(P)-dependent dehydrogenase (short-subunit alcohol dehydrogenase family)